MNLSFPPNGKIESYHHSSGDCGTVFQKYLNDYWILQHVKEVDKYAYLDR
jgi:hypothetical protein